MRPENLKTKIFLDSGDPNETRDIFKLLGFLDGQTTNPTLISKNPQARARLQSGQKFLEEEIYDFYKKIIKEISELIPGGSVSIEVYADQSTALAQMFAQSREMYNWIPNDHIKFPITDIGLQAARKAIAEKMRVNMTLCFSQEQAAAVYAGTAGAKKGDVFVSPFIGRLDDKGQNGLDLIANIIKMYESSDGHAQTLSASVRNINHFMACLSLGSDIITAPFEILKEWDEAGLPLPGANFKYDAAGARPIPYQELDINKDWRGFNVKHELTDKGIERFAEDWNKLIKINPKSQYPNLKTQKVKGRGKR